MNQNDQTINEQINLRYSKYAQEVLGSNAPLQVNADGSAPQINQSSPTLAERLYSQGELVDIPEPAVNASLGCGNPFSIANLKQGEYVLDLGSGGGLDCFQAAKIVGADGYVIGVDATSAMITLANKNKEKMDVSNVEFRHGKIENLPVASNTIDLIISNCVIDVSPDKTAVFQEAYRVLKPGGRMVISDTVLMGEFHPQLKANIDLWAGAVITPLITLDDYLQFIIASGFSDVRIESLTSYGLENFDQLDAESQRMLTKEYQWTSLPPKSGLYSALIWARKP